VKLLANRRHIINRFRPAKDGWILLVPGGEHHWSDGEGDERTLVIDAESLTALENSFKTLEDGESDAGPELLIDFEHESHDPEKRTEAAGWIDDVQIRDQDLWAHVRWTDLGDQSLQGGRYRFISPTFDGDQVEDLGNGRERMRILTDAGLTNRPNMPVPALSNNQQKKNSNPTLPGKKPGRINNQKKGDPHTMTLNEETMAKLLSRLGVDPASADLDTEVSAALDALPSPEQLENMETIEEENKQLAEELVESAVDSLDPANEEEKKELENVLRNSTDRKATLKFLKNTRAKKAPARQAITNRKPGQAPESGTVDNNDRATDKARWIKNRAHELRANSGNKRPFNACWKQAEGEAETLGK
jgi:phage I-like protein